MNASGAEEARSRGRAENFRTLFDGDDGVEHYKGIPIFAAPGVHQAALDLLKAHLPPTRERRVLELGAGSGAMSLRLHEAGYTTVASDLFSERFVPAAQIRFLPLDLNQAFSTDIPERFDAVVALELIEHLENPHHFIRECAGLLAPGGFLVLSTPNIGSPLSQAMAAVEGAPQWFSPEDWCAQGHISPISAFTLGRIAAGSALRCIAETSVADPWRMRRKRRHPRLWLLSTLISFLGQPASRHRGEVYLAIFQKH